MSRQAWRSVLTIIAGAITLAALAWAFIPQPSAQPEAQLPASTELLPWQSEFIEGYENTLGPVEEDEIDPLLTSAVVICAYLDQGHTFPEAWTLGVDLLGMSSDQTAVVIEAAVRTKCTAYEPQLQREATA